jgi:hypothetical protein
VEKKKKTNYSRMHLSFNFAGNSDTRYEGDNFGDIFQNVSLLKNKVECPLVLVKTKKLGCNVRSDVSYLGPEQTSGCSTYISCNTEVAVGSECSDTSHLLSRL